MSTAASLHPSEYVNVIEDRQAQELLRKKPGVISTRAGYSGANTPNATYRNHGDHAESVEIVFDPDVMSFRDLLEFFFQIHDPSTQDRQGNDIRRSYRSAIFYTSDDQRQVALDTITDVNASGLWPGKVVTEVEPAGDFWEAEEVHQDYLQKYPDGYTCHYARPGWKLTAKTAMTSSRPQATGTSISPLILTVSSTCLDQCTLIAPA